LDKFVNNKEINNLYLLLSDPIDVVGENIVKIDMLDEQPTYQDVFNIINTVTKSDDINIIINSDCYIDEPNIQLIKENIDKKQVYCLSRWDILSLSPFSTRHFNSSESQDAWVFIGKMNTNIKSNFKMGVSGCDNAIAYEFKRTGYMTSNPSKDIKVIHYHLSNIRTYGNIGVTKEIHRIRLPYHFIMPASLDEKPVYQPQPNSGLIMSPTPVGEKLQVEPETIELTPAKLRIRQRFINK
jgi:hypothetical protein